MSKPEQLIAKPSGEEAIQNNEPAAVPALSVGEQLAHMRKQHGWSIDDVANQLKLAPRQIYAIETDDYDALPTIVMTRGYIRSYAKMLGLDPATILPSTVPVNAAKVQVFGKQPNATIFSESRLLLAGRNSRVPYNWIFGVVGVIVIGLVLAQFGGLSILRQAPVSSGSSLPASAAATSSNGATVETGNAAQEQAAKSTENITDGAALAPVAVVAEALKPGVPAVGAVSAVGAVNQLSLTFKQDSWVEIRRADKTSLYSRVGKAGTTETFDINQPVSLVVGNLAGVEATFRGAAVDLKAGAKSNIARLNLK
ncbi:helix-turn-helix domain-containing protein [Glaciimonas immobilis]|uniref:Cytoskeleton protein RodZ n=1 Tax=Glaciimonas immobilis TaxID=728004 RepID=A0A840RJ82_9BURK|nr:helix-turn-helix domain-containing protein [Glaciimonas immobilis]KAF3998853.1 DUF4115 domain-containing protein [Glaciimonas immobilis]MBB5198247.1 cytoskeleton protein RodZ [Glaciimonas immobilis]